MNVLIVDDHPMMLEYLSGAVARAFDGVSVHTAPDLEAGLQSVRERPFHLALLDLGLPGCGGIESLLRFRKQFPDIRVVVVSAVEDQAAIRGALAAGASGYIPKTANPKLVVNALRLIAEGGTYVPPQALADEIGRGPDSTLTDRQREVMQQLLRGRTIGQIARDLGIAEATAKHHAHAVYAAFGVSSRADFILSANRRGVAAG
jgi:two-component system, NarL family, nitrate/nitrite response regulator NarL